jgi:UDPglucose 6-dehydrogenase
MAAEASGSPFRLRVTCIGAGYVGGPTMAVIAKNRPDVAVTVVDISESKIRAWNSSSLDDLPVYEPGLQEIVAETRGRNLHFSTNVEDAVADADLVFLCVDTPTKAFGVGAGSMSNTSNLEACVRTVAKHARERTVIVEKSTVPVRTAESLRAILTANARADCEFEVLSNPEFLAEGTAIADLQKPARVLIGGNNTPSGNDAVRLLADLYAAWVPPDRIITTSLWSSELSKLVANAFLAQRISSINSISALCERTGADVSELASVIGSDPRIGPKFLSASVGFGGSCFQKDVLNLVYIARHLGLEDVAVYWQQVIRMNDYQKRRFVQNIFDSMFRSLSGKTIAVFGFAFKKDTGDTRESAAAYVVKQLLDERARVCVYDPKVTLDRMWWELRNTCGATEDQLRVGLRACGDPLDACDDADAIVVATEWDEFRDLNYEVAFARMRKPAFLFDGRGILNLRALREIGFTVSGIGIPLDSGAIAATAE